MPYLLRLVCNRYITSRLAYFSVFIGDAHSTSDLISLANFLLSFFCDTALLLLLPLRFEFLLLFELPALIFMVMSALYSKRWYCMYRDEDKIEEIVITMKYHSITQKGDLG